MRYEERVVFNIGMFFAAYYVSYILIFRVIPDNMQQNIKYLFLLLGYLYWSYSFGLHTTRS
jgi:hypothetical protein